MDLFLKALRKVFKTKVNASDFDKIIDHNGEKASEYIYNQILKNKPLLIARIGANEFNCITGYLMSESGLNKYYNYITGNLDAYKIDDNIIKITNQGAGVFPPTKSIIEKFAKRTLTDLNHVDILGVWLKENKLLKKELKQKTVIPLRDIEPYYHNNPWTKALEGKKVLVIHPFAKSILKQYEKREELFSNTNILPQFSLKAIKSVQSIAGEKTEFKDWFDALKHMENQIAAVDFDIAIIGCGAYGLSLGAYVKRIGKQAIHMGGATQILFGIKGKRWDEHPVISKLYNEHWVKPLAEETPSAKNKVEDGCYW